ncbi:MAG TPA: hypothetical protein DHD79_03225 [Firmicutes bacterium]|jgi:fucose permease|nr:hypothetical protein [Bacillota bacterium]HCF91778.1 hypothetical protein [Bacillota bacterium]HCX70235.1 hypothetical protein [Bacillota bacterium]
MDRKLKFIQYFGFITAGMVGTLIAPLLPEVRTALGLTYSQVGAVLSAQSIGTLIAALAGGYAADRFGKKSALLAGSASLLLGLLLIVLARSFAPAFLSMICIGTGFGVYQVAINALCADTSGTNKGAAMNRLHVFYGLGAICGPVLSALLLGQMSWRTIFAVSSIAPLVMIGALFLIRIPGLGSTPCPDPASASTATAASTAAPASALTPVAISDKRSAPKQARFHWYGGSFLLLTGLILFFYVGLEVSVFGWLPSFWDSLTWANAFPPALTSGVFWLSLTIGRLIAGRISDRLGFGKFLMGACLASAVLALSWWAVQGGLPALLLIFVLGMAMGGIFPTAMVSVISQYPGRTATVSGTMSLIASFGGLIVPAAVGRVADQGGISVLPAAIAIVTLALFLASVVTWVPRLARRR